MIFQDYIIGLLYTWNSLSATSSSIPLFIELVMWKCTAEQSKWIHAQIIKKSLEEYRDAGWQSRKEPRSRAQLSNHLDVQLQRNHLIYLWFGSLISFFFTLFYFTILYWFCHTSTWIHHGCTWVPNLERPLPPPSPYHLSGSSQCTSPKHPVSCIEPRLVIHFLYDIIHVSMPFSQIIPPLSLYHRVQKSVLYICVSFAVSHTGLSLPSF